MGFFDFLRERQDVEVLDYGNDALLRTQWISHFFLLRSARPNGVSHEEFILRLEKSNDKVLSFVLAPTIGMDAFGKSVSIVSCPSVGLPNEYCRYLPDSNDRTYFTLIRFPDLKKAEKGRTFYGHIYSNERRNYLFSPVQAIQTQQIMPKVEFALMAASGREPRELMTKFTQVKNEVYVTDSDGLQYLSYPLSKRAELHIKHADIERKVFGVDFTEFVTWILNKEKDSEYMQQVVSNTRKILKRYKLAL